MFVTTHLRHVRAPLRRALAVLAALALIAVSAAAAQAAVITRYSAFECTRGTVTVYFPELRTGGGNEAVSFLPELYVYTASGWQRANRPTGWYNATAGPNGIYTINGYKWFVRQSPYQNVAFRGLAPGHYAVVGHLVGGTSHWAHVYGSSSTSCYVS